MRDLLDRMTSLPTHHKCRDISLHLLAFALSSRSAFFVLANYANKSLRVETVFGLIYAESLSGDNQSYDNTVFINFCKKYVSQLQIRDFEFSEEPCAKLCDYLAGMTNLEDVDTSPARVPLCHGFTREPKLERYGKLLIANPSFSTLNANMSFLDAVDRLPTKIHFPNLTKLVINVYILGKIDVSRFTRHTFPALNSVYFLESRLSREGIKKLAEFCDITHRSISVVEIGISKIPYKSQRVSRNFQHLDFICEQFNKIKFHNKFTLTVNVPVRSIDIVELGEAAFVMEDDHRWSYKKDINDTSIIYNVFDK
uniref:F-box domain-containing protein n=1 Tax=Panagrellus redivivus TaxID=6233 RepID=A0A7E4UTU4_PANRE